MVYRPVRERDVERLKQLAVTMLHNTGYDEISLSSLSSSDYSKLPELVNFLIEECSKRKINISLPSLRIDAFSLDVMSKVQDVKKSSLTFAPEAGTQRSFRVNCTCHIEYNFLAYMYLLYTMSPTRKMELLMQ